MSASIYETMLAFSRTLTDEHIDERQEAVTVTVGKNQKSIMNYNVHVRGELDGRALVVSYHDYYFVNMRSSEHLRDILEVFVAADHLCFEGECRQRDVLDWVARWFGGGGIRGSHSLFHSRRVDQAEPGPLSDFERPEFAARLEALSGRPDCIKVQLQARTGINAVFRGHNLRGGLPRVQAQVLECVALAAS